MKIPTHTDLQEANKTITETVKFFQYADSVTIDYKNRTITVYIYGGGLPDTYEFNSDLEFDASLLLFSRLMRS